MPRSNNSIQAALAAFAWATAIITIGLPPFSAHAATSDQSTTTSSAASCTQVSTPNQKKDGETIRRIEQAWLTAEYHGHREYLECLLEADYHTSSRSGLIRSRADVIERVPTVPDESRPVPKLDTIVVIHGNAASAHSILKSKDATGNPKEVHFVDTYTFHNGRLRWRRSVGQRARRRPGPKAAPGVLDPRTTADIARCSDQSLALTPKKKARPVYS